MLATLVPLFDENMAVSAYSLFAQKSNYLLNPRFLGTGSNDGATNIAGLEIIESMGIETLSNDKEVFVEVNNISVFADISSLCSAPHDRIVLLADQTITPDAMYVARFKELKKMGYRIAIRKLTDEKIEEYHELLLLMEFILLDHKKHDMDKTKQYFSSAYPDMKLCAVNVDSKEEFDELKASGGYTLYEGDFFRLPVTKGEEEVTPLKVNYINLLNMVNDSDFELTKAADVIGRDTALVISLLKMVNRMAVNSEITSIRHAAAMLGQKELRKWINTAVTNELCADRPNEVTRISLLRAKFAENLAPTFGMEIHSSELFLMGLFSVIDLILGKPMKEALEMVKLSKSINEALVDNKGELAPVLDFIIQYERASWQEVSRQMLLLNINLDSVYDAYIKSLKWYRDLFE
ncbi:MAG: HDOD domain-containing protein [Lachnospiraceae bacterium]|nr:HDOD domain-containing protein [Lachnospiraceae bacterium]